MADAANKYAENVDGKFYVDDQCIDCDLCRETAPANFKRNDDGGHSFSSAGPQPSIQALMRVENGFVTCFGFINPVDIPFTATVWIDVSGTSAANCSPNVLSPQCQPAPSDPQAHQSAVLRYGQTTQIRLDVVDPP